MDLFAGSSLDALVARAKQRLGTGDFDEANRLVSRGLEKYPDAQVLRETRLTIRRAQARAGMQSLKDQIARDDDVHAHEQLIALYQEVDMPAEARRAAQAYVTAHPDHDTPHLLLGEMLLQSYFEDMQTRDAHPAQEHLLRAARLNAQALKPRLLLAELYFCCGADQALAVVVGALERLAPDDETIKPVLEACRTIPRPTGKESVEALFARVEVTGELLREPTAWPLRTRRNRDQRVKDERMLASARRVVAKNEAEEVAIVRRNGALIAHAGGEETQQVDESGEDKVPEKGLPGVAAGIARTVARQVREFDLGAFKRCTIQGPFGIVVVGEVGGVLAAARHRAGVEPLRLWERLTVALEGAR